MFRDALLIAESKLMGKKIQLQILDKEKKNACFFTSWFWHLRIKSMTGNYYCRDVAALDEFYTFPVALLISC